LQSRTCIFNPGIRDCRIANPGIRGPRRNWRSIVKSTKIATWEFRVAIFELEVCTIVLYICGFSADVCVVNRTIIYYYNYYSASRMYRRHFGFQQVTRLLLLLLLRQLQCMKRKRVKTERVDWSTHSPTLWSQWIVRLKRAVSGQFSPLPTPRSAHAPSFFLPRALHAPLHPIFGPLISCSLRSAYMVS